MEIKIVSVYVTASLIIWCILITNHFQWWMEDTVTFTVYKMKTAWSSETVDSTISRVFLKPQNQRKIVNTLWWYLYLSPTRCYSIFKLRLIVYYSRLKDWNLLKGRCYSKGTLKPGSSREGSGTGMSRVCMCCPMQTGGGWGGVGVVIALEFPFGVTKGGYE